ncbi:cytochrome P450 [Catellatospora tritici]|uniref:cytochrome P450 n=1 Tax=Catellatospora tritici TaxID=2851566 RepID=UPI001C2D0848|nr:cytochrome P450 [Catellatospora tritici]MBV1852950.1 cytochrome P450 [Catellatospora tritici]
MTEPSIFTRIVDFANRADPYPLFQQLREQPVRREEDGTFVVSTYREIEALLHDPRISSDGSNLLPEYAAKAPPTDTPGSPGASFIRMDPPDHDRIRRIVNRQFGPPHRPTRVADMYPDLEHIVTRLVDGFAGKHQGDIVDDLAYPFPVAVICELLGVPPEDEPRFSAWVEPIVDSIAQLTPDRLAKRDAALRELGMYLFGLAQQRRQNPGPDMLSGFVTDDGPEGRLEGPQLMATLVLLLIAGHETTVNLIANGTLTLLRHPQWLERLRQEPELSIRVVEEVLRYEPSVHFLPNRTCVADIGMAGMTITKGAPITLVLAAGNRDPEYVRDADVFDPERENNQHLAFGSGVHYCFGAPLARLEAQIALTQIAQRLANLRLVEDPPPYRPSPVLRGPIHLPVTFDEVKPAG